MDLVTAQILGLMVMGKIQDEFQVSSWALDEGTDTKNKGEDQDAAERCVI